MRGAGRVDAWVRRGWRWQGCRSRSILRARSVCLICSHWGDYAFGCVDCGVAKNTCGWRRISFSQVFLGDVLEVESFFLHWQFCA